MITIPLAFRRNGFLKSRVEARPMDACCRSLLEKLIIEAPDELRADFYAHIAAVLSPPEMAELSDTAKQSLGMILNPYRMPHIAKASCLGGRKIERARSARILA